MSRKKDEVDYSLPGDVGHDFEDEADILNYKPTIVWDPPPPEEGDEPAPAEATYVNDSRKRAEGIAEGYSRIVALTNAVQLKIDDRVKKLGGLTITLDPVQDFATIAAIKRRFPDIKDPTKLTYDMYKKALACAQQNTKPTVPRITAKGILAARQNPALTNFGGYGEQPGNLRREIVGPSFGKPVNMDEFQKNASLDLFKLQEVLRLAETTAQIKIHETTMKHG